ncbi:MAG: glycosyltransferase [Coriobacteriia bacterium]|nr:glycosyltransferase [Coriobacteriia bacterium]
MRKVALVSEHASPLGALGGVDSGGQNVYVAQLAAHLARLGWTVDVFTRADAVGLPETTEAAPGVRVVHVPAGPARFVRKEDMLPYMGEFSDFFEGYARRERYALLHANFFMSALVAAEVKRRTATPFVVTFHALGEVRRMHQGNADGFPEERLAIERRAVAEADRVIAECPQDLEDLVGLYGADPSRTPVVPCGFDPGELWPVDRVEARLRLGLDSDRAMVLQLGRMVPRKGVDTVVRALAHLRGAHGVEADLVVVGGESSEPDPRVTPEIGRLLGIADECGVGDLVRFAGSKPRDELRYFYGAADVFVTVPWYEPFGITPLEAMACAKPVVGSAVGGIKHTVVDGETGFLVPPKEPEALAARLAALLAEPRVARRFGEAGRKRALRLFTWEVAARQLDEVYREVAESAAAVPLAAPKTADPRDAVARSIDGALAALDASRGAATEDAARVAGALRECLERGGKLLVCGNGGSAADTQHFVAELVCLFRRRDRRPMRAIALTADAAVMTAWSNDAGFEEVFARQVEALGEPGDALLAISTSGRSANVTRALRTARLLGMSCLALLGGDGGEALRDTDAAVVVPSHDTPRVQEVHITLLHAIAEVLEEAAAAVGEEGETVGPKVVPVHAAAAGHGTSRLRTWDGSASGLP